MPTKPLLLTIDDDPMIRQNIVSVANSAGFECIEAGNPQEISLALTKRPDIIVLDLTMPDMDGYEVLWELKRQHFNSGIILSSGFFDQVVKGAEVYARKSGLNFMCRLDKPYSLSYLKKILSETQNDFQNQLEVHPC